MSSAKLEGRSDKAADAVCHFQEAEKAAAAGDTELSWGALRLTCAAALIDGEPPALLPDQTADDLAALAGWLVGCGRTGRARAALALASGKGRERAAVLLARARLEWAAGLVDVAAALAGRAALLNPGLADAHLMVADHLSAGGKTTAARARLHVVLAIEPRHGDAYRRLGDLWRRQRRLDMAERSYRTALEIDHGNVAALHGLSAVLRDTGRHAEALQPAQRAVELAPDDPWHYVQVGNILSQLARSQEAVAAYRAALDLRVYLPGVPGALGRQLLKTGQLLEAAVFLGFAAVEAGTSAVLMAEVGDIYLRAGRPADSVPWYRRVVAVDAGSERRAALGRALLACGRWTEGFSELAQAVAKAAPPVPGANLPRGARLLVDGAGLDTVEQIALSGLLPALIRRGVSVTFVCSPELALMMAAWTIADLKLIAAPPDGLDDGALGNFDACISLVAIALDKAKVGALWPEPYLRPSNDLNGFVQPWPGSLTTPELTGAAQGELADALASAGAVLGAPGPAMALAGAMGRSGAVLVSSCAGWVWSHANGRGQWFPSLAVIPIAQAGDASSVVALVRSIPEMSLNALCEPQLPAQAIAAPHFADAVCRIPLLAEAVESGGRCEPLLGGFHNTLFRLTGNDDDLVVRLGCFPGLRWDSYEMELRHASVGARSGLAPEVLAADVADGTMVTAFVHGLPMTPDLFRSDPARLRQAALLYRQLHCGPAFFGEYKVFGLIDGLRATIGSSQDIPEGFDGLSDLGERIGGVRRLLRATMPSLAPCHNDPAAHNFIGVDGGLRLLDWQCSAQSDPHWELGAFTAEADLSEEQALLFFSTYFGCDNLAVTARVTLHRAVSHYLWLMQSLVWVLEGRDGGGWLNSARHKYDSLRGELASARHISAANDLTALADR